MRVPPWVAVPADVLEKVVGADVLARRDWVEARRRIRDHAFEPAWIDGLRAQLDDLGVAGPVAVRSSSESEDTDALAWAGMYTSRLNVPADRLEDAIREVWSSAFSETVQAYAAMHGLSEARPSMAVLIQAMLAPESSGVAFGVHPVTRERGVVVISATWGLGEGVVVGDLPTDTFTVRDGQVEAVLGDKIEAIFPAADGGTERRAVPDEQREAPSLSNDHVIEIVGILERLDADRGGPVDLEWAVADGALFVVQARPVTAQADSPAPCEPQGEPVVWDNNNLIDNYPGLTLPLTVSFVRGTYRMGNRHLASLLGLPDAVIEANDGLFAHMVGAIRGRLYYNLTNIRALLGLLPASGLTIRYYDEAIGAQPDGTASGRIGGGDLVGIARTLVAVVGGFARLRRERDAFQAWIEPKLAEIEARDFEALDAGEMLAAYRDIEEQIFGRWRAPALNGFLAMLFLGTLRRLAKQWGLDDERPNLVNELVAAGEDSVSKEIVDEVLAIAALVREEPARRALFDEHDDEALADALAASDDEALQLRVGRYLVRYGDRSVGGELKFETPSYRERPALLFRVIRSHLGERPAAAREDTTALETSATALVDKVLARRPVRRALFSWVLRHTRDLVRWREDFRFLRTRVFAQARRIYRALGRSLSDDRRLQSADDVLWLTTAEVADLVGAHLDAEEARRRVAERRRRYATWKDEQLPERIVWAGDPDRYVPPLPAAIAAGARFQGTGCSPGVVRGRARVIHSADQLGDLGGDILVAVSTDTGWVQYFPTAAGIVVERGSLLSHIAIVTRELGIPSVIGARGVTQAVRDGDRLQIDGSTGEVLVLGPDEDQDEEEP